MEQTKKEESHKKNPIMTDEEFVEYIAMLEMRRHWEEKKFAIGAYTFLFMCVIASVFVFGLASITLIHLWKVWV